MAKNIISGITLSINPLDMSQGISVSIDTPYQKNVAKVEEPKKEEWNTRSMLARIDEIGKSDPDKATEMMDMFNTLQQDPTSKYYNPYALATNRSVANLAAYGVDTSTIDDAFFENNKYLLQHLTYDGTTNTPTKPGKKATAQQKAAYEYYQILKSESATQKAEQQWSALQQELNYWANRKDLNLSDDEILAKINWNNYGELTSMDKNKSAQPNEYNRSIGYSQDALYGVIWQARNPEYTGSIYGAMANSYNGVGNVWQYNEEIAKKRDPNSPEFNPYSLGSVGIDDACLYYGVNSFDENWLNEHREDAYSNDTTRKQMYSKVYTAIQNTKKAEEAADALKRWIAKNSKNWVNEETAKRKIDAKLSDGKIKLDGKEYDISILNKMDASMGKEGEPGSGSMVSTTKAVNYKYDQMLNGVYRIVEGNKSRKNGSEYSDSVASGSTTNARTGEKTGDTVYKTDSETNAIVDAENAQLQEAADALEDAGLTKAEQAAMQSMSWSGVFGVVKGTIDKIKGGIGIPVDSETMANAQAKTVSDLSTAVLNDAGLMQEYNLIQQDKAEWEKKKADIEEAAGLLADKAKWQKAGFSLESWNQTGGDITAQPAWDLLTDGQKAILTAMAVDSGEAEIAEEFDSFIDMNRKQVGELTEEEQNTLNNYQDAVNFIAKDQKYMDDNQKAYDEAVRKQEQAMAQYRDTIEMLKANGADTQKMEDAYNVTQFFTRFTQYDPTQWTAYNMFHEYSMAAYAGDGNWDALLKEAQGYDKEIAEMITLGEWSLMYAERNGIVVPDSIKENVQRWIDSMRREHEDFQYLQLMDDMGFQEDAEKGKQKLLENSEKFDWDAYNASGSIEGMPLFYILPEETKQDLIRLDERYRNGEQNAIEMVDEYLSSVAYFDLDHRTFNNLGFLGGTTNAADVMTDYEQATYYFLLETQGAEAAEKYYQHLSGDYGVLQTRAAEMTKKGAYALAESGFWGRRAADVVSMLLSPIAAVGSLYYMADTELKKLRGERVEINPNNVNLSANIYKKEARAKIQEEINEVYKDNPTLRTIMSGLQEIISNRGDSLVNAVTFGPLFSGISSGIAQEFMSALPMAFTAATDAVADAKEKGASDTQLLGVFLATMIAEAGTETISIHNIKNAFTAGKAVTGGMMKQFLINWLTESGISEMVGESLNDVIENLADELALGDLSEFQESVDRYMQEEHMSEEDAIAAARRDQVMGVLHTALISYLSPGMDIVSYGAGYLKTLNAYRRYAKARQKIGYSDSMFELMRRDREAMEAAAVSPEEDTGETAPEAEPAAETAQETAPEATPETAPAATPEAAPVSGPVADAAATVAAKAAPVTAPVIAGPVATDYSLLESAKDADAASKSAVVASVIDTEGTPESGDIAMAVASDLDAFLDLVSDDDNDTVSFMEKMLIGANKAGIDSRIIKQAITHGALSWNSEAWSVMQSAAFRAAVPEQKARMLADTVVQDAASKVVQDDIARSVHQNRVARAISEPIVAGEMKPVLDAYGDVRSAQQKAENAREQRDTILGVVQAKEEALKDAQAVYDSDPANKVYQGMLETAINELEAANQVLNEYDQMVAKAEQEQTDAEDKLNAARENALKTVREIAEAKVAEEDAQRSQAQAEAEQAAKVEAEQQAQIAQEQAKAQAEEDERTGKTTEDEQMGMIDKYVDSLATDPETKERLRKALKDRQLKKNTGNIDLSKRLTDSEAMLALGAFQRKLGIPIMFSDDLGNANGKYENGIIYLNGKKAQDGSMRLGQALVEVALHEITHSLEITNNYKQYRDVVLGTLYGMGDEMDGDKLALDIKRKQEAYARQGVTLSEEEAEKEIVADFARLHLSDKEVVQRMMDAGLGGRIRNALHNINQALKNFFSRLTGADRTLAEALRKAERAYQKALVERAKTTVHPGSEQFSISQFAQATNMTYDEKTQTLYNQRGEKVDGVTVKVTAADIAQTPVGKLIDIGLSDEPVKDADGNVRYLTDNDGNAVLDANGNPVVMTQKNAAIGMFTGLMNMISMLKDQNLVWEIAGSALESTFSALKSNSDTQYHDTIDFGTICAKTQAIVNVMSNVMLDRLQANKQAIKEGRPQDVSYGLTREDVLKIYNETHKAGLSVPCPVCYVFSRWMGVPSLLGSMSRFQHDYVDIEYDENGNPVMDENGYAKFNRETTQERANEYIRKMHKKYKDKDGVNDRKEKVTKDIESKEDNHVKIASEIEVLEGQLKDKTLTQKKRDALKEKLKAKKKELVQNAREATKLDNELRELEAYNWITQALCKQVKHKNAEGKTVTENVKDENGNYIIDPDFQVTPDEVLLDLRRTGEFSDRYAKNWGYRTSRGAGMGKTILPYSGASLGDILLGSKTRVASSQNPFFTGYEDGKATKALMDARERARRQNLIGGQRLQSTSDFRPEWGLDYIMAFLELQAAQSNAQMYTKVVEAVDLFASAGADVNLSIMGQGQGYHEATPEEIALSETDTKEGRELKSRMGIGKDGTVYVLDFSSVTGMDYNAAKEKTKNYDNAQMILVGMNDQHIRLAMANGDIDFIIPWHSSGNSKDVLSQLVASVEETLETSSDYTKVQTDDFIEKTEFYTDENGKRKSKKVDGRTQQQKDAWSARIKILTGIAENEIDQEKPEKGGLTDAEWAAIKDDEQNGTGLLMELYQRFYKRKGDKCYHVALTASQAKQIFPYEYWQTDPSKKGGTKKTADENGRRFIAYCQMLGVTPRFSGKMDKKTKEESANFAGAIFDQETGDIVRYDPKKMDKGYWKLLIDRKMYGNDGKYREQRTIDTSRINIGNVDDQGRISDDSMLPREASAKYGIASLEQQAARASERIIEKPFDLESRGQDGQMLYADDFTEADLDEMLEEAGIEYQDAVERGDMETAQKIIDESAERAGYTIKVYHGTPNSGRFNVFDPSKLNNSSLSSHIGQGFYFTDSKEGAEEYTWQEDVYGRRKVGNNPYLFEGYIKLANPIEVTEKSSDIPVDTLVSILSDGNYDWFFESGLAHDIQGVEIDGVKRTKEEIQSMSKEERIALYASFLHSQGDMYALSQLVHAFKYGDQGLLIESMKKHTGRDGIHWRMSNGVNQYVIFDSSQFKDSSPVTYDENGNVIPLDQRFQRDNPDIRYSMDNGEYTEADLDDMLRQAGIAAPIHDTQQAAASLGWTTRKTKDATLVYDENGERIGTMEKGRIIIDPDNPNAEAYKQALNGVRFGPGETGATLEGENPMATTSLGTAVRAFAADEGMLSKSDELDNFAKAVVQAQNTYFPDTNAEQIQRAVRWIRSLKTSPESDGYAEAFRAVTDPSFDYRSADGQARMVAVMAMAIAKNDKLAQAAITDSFMRQGTDLGRALQARKMFLLMTPEGRKISLENTMRGLQSELEARGYKGKPLTLSDWVMAAAAAAENPEDFERVQEAAAGELAEQMPVSWKDKLRSWRMLSMLMNPRTHIRNIVGNMLFVPAVGIKNKLAAVMELGVKKGNKTKTLAPFLSKEARDFARKDAKEQKLVLKGEAKYGQETKVKQQQKIFGNGKTILSKVGGGLLNALSKGNSWALEGEDWIFLKGHYRRALGGWMMANGYSAAQLEANPQLLEKGRAYAIQEAQKATYRDFNQLAQTLNQVSRKGGAAGFIVDAVLPFKKTPANILKRGLEYSPAGIVKNLTADLYHLKQYMDYQNGKLKVLPTNAISPTQFIDNLCSGLTGSAIMAAGFLLANTGIVRCGLKDDDDEFDKLEGAQEYSFEISIGGYDVSFTMDWAAPMSMPFFVGAAIQNQLSKEGEIDVQEVVNAISNIAEPVFNLSMLDGVNTVFKTSQNDDTTTITQILAKIGSNYATSYVPSALGAYTRAADPIRRKAYVKSGEGGGVMGTVRYAIEQTKNKIPGQSEKSIPVRDAFGRTTDRPDWQRWVESFVSPGYISFKQDDAVVEELRGLFNRTGNKKMIPSMPDKSFQAGGESVKMDAQQYDQLTVDRGQTAYNLIKELMDNEYYKMVPDQDKAAMIEDAWTFATQNAKYNVNPNANVDKWVLNSRTNPVQGIINRRKDKIDAEYIAGYKQGALEAVRDGSNANLDVCLEKLEEAGVNNPEGTVKTYVANAYRPEYIRAYQDGDRDKMNEIETLLINSDLDFDDDDFEDWIENMYKQTQIEEE